MPRALAITMTFALAGCGSSAKPVQKKTPPKRPIPAKPQATAEPELLLGQMCPGVAAGRPAVVPLAFRAGIWMVDGQRSARLVAGRMARQFTVLSWSGDRAGFFQVAGAATTGGRTWAVGSFAGSPPCTDDEGEAIDECMQVMGGCGLALARLEPSGGLGARPFEEDPEPLAMSPTGVCVDRDELAVDVDGDGTYELFDRRKLVVGDGLATELVAGETAKRRCSTVTSFAELAPGVSLVAAADIDEDGRVELVIARRDGNREEWAIFRSLQTPRRLDRVVVAPAYYSRHSQSASAPAAPR